MNIDDLVNQVNQQYEEVDSKEEVVEEKIDLDEILKANKITEKWLDEEREYQKNSKDDNFSRDAFTKRSDTTSSSKTSSNSSSSDKKSSYSYVSSEERKSPYSYGSYSSSSSSKTTKNSDELFYEKVEAAFNDKVDKMVDKLINKSLNRITDECSWDILDLQYELNKKRVTDRDYEEEEITQSFNSLIEKHSAHCSRKIDVAELLILLKVNPHNN